MEMRIYTVGHSNHSLEFFLEILERFSIKALVDVRSYPHSRYVPHFNRENLEKVLGERGIEYIWMGDALGGKFTLGKKREFLRPDGKIDWEAVRRAGFFQDGIKKLLSIARGKNTAIMCAEENPYRCHRGFLIAPALLEAGVEVLHIRKNLKVHPHKIRR